ncbi:FecR family protein [Chitinophaga alhagiae]|uniref:FecR family protein n=1 Tax=Chitinophaga alhagiae TaxID=2203219 RepID=UPI000E5AFDA0|nr:FecR family protein [Chitinophaga alhagiae]
MDQEQAARLLERYNSGTATAAERAMVERWYESEAAGRKLGDDQFFEHLNQQIWQGIAARTGLVRSTPIQRSLRNWRQLAAAAAVLLLLSGGLLFYLAQRPAATVVADRQPAAITPGGNKAILKLGDGSEISLTDAAEGELAQQAGVRIVKTKEGQLVYQPADAGVQEGKYNTISTPRGGQYRIDLPDGTKVWLNAASSLVFPATFAGLRERKVELTGEAYFDVAANENKPFMVTSHQQTVQVLGTQFNINAYADEPEVKTTLLHGAVKVNGTLLKPGQQALVQGGSLRVVPVETAAETAWKNGEFVFNGQSFAAVMRTISRWYDVEVVYDHTPGALHIGGEVSRSRNLPEVLKMLEVTGDVKFKIEGRTITVTK